ncbi:MAG: hypothetical protein ACKN9T_05300 [Candidatus Methylumidiphilus sp.]
MALFMTRTDVNWGLDLATHTAAISVGIPGAEWEPSDQLLAAIQTKNAGLAKSLSELILAYDNWCSFNEQIEAEGKAGNLDASANAKLCELIDLRNSKLSEFLEALKGQA